MEYKAAMLPLFFILFFIYEFIAPYYSYGVSRFHHALVNIASGAAAYLINVTVFYLPVRSALAIDRGLADLFPDGFMKLAAGLILFDLWMYIWHRMNHELPFLWRFHKAHHSDTAMDVSTGVRFHPLEVVLSTMARIPVYILIGVNPYMIGVYEGLMTAVVLFHHSNIRIGLRADDLLSLIVPTPRMHRVHHSDFYKETNSNYGTVLSVWDRLFGTFNKRRDTENIRIGLERYRTEKDQTLSGFLITPFK